MLKMVSKPHSQSGGSRRHPPPSGDPTPVDQRPTPTAAATGSNPPRTSPRRSASSSAERSANAGAAGSARTLPASVHPSHQAQQHGKPPKGSTSKATGSHSLPAHVPTRGPDGGRRPPSHRPNPSSAPSQPSARGQGPATTTTQASLKGHVPAAQSQSSVRAQGPTAQGQTSARGQGQVTQASSRGQMATAQSSVRGQVGTAQSSVRGQMATAQSGVRASGATAQSGVRAQAPAAHPSIKVQVPGGQSTLRGQVPTGQSGVRGHVSNAQNQSTARGQGPVVVNQPLPTRGRPSANVLNVRVDVNPDRQNPSRDRRPTATSSSTQRQAAGHGSAAAVSSTSTANTEPRSSQPTRKPSSSTKDPKERYIRQMQMKQAATLPPGGTASRSRTRPVSDATNAQSLNRTATTSSTAPRPSQPQSSPNRDSQGPSQVSVSAVPSQDPRRERGQDIARITVNARSIINRAAANSNNQDPTNTGGQQARSHQPVFRPNNRNLTVPPTSQSNRTHAESQHLSGANNSNPNRSDRNSRSIVDPSNLHLDIVNLIEPQDEGANNQANSPQIFSGNLNAGVYASRHERPEVNEALPDILNSHVLPPYTVRQNQHRPPRQNNHRGRSIQTRSHRHSRSQPGVTQIDDEEKGCCTHESCLSCLTILTTFRWVLVSLALLGVMCVITGIILGALHMTVGSSYLTLSLMFIGLGVMLVIVVGVGWKCTPQGHEPCHLLFNLGEHCTRDVTTVSRRRHRERNHWYGGVSYPEFRYRRPPPSYNASMQEYQQQLMLAQLQLNNSQPNNNNLDNNNSGICPADLPPSYVLEDNYSLPSSPPPSYKSRASTIRPGLHITFPPQGEDYPTSRPPTYRSRAGTGHRPGLDLQSDESGCFDNQACSDTEPPTSSSDSSRRQSDAATSESAGSSTLHRVDQVVGYLDNVLDGHDRTLEHNNAPSSSRVENRDEAGDGSTKAEGSGTNTARENSAPTEDNVRIRDTPL